MRCFHIDKIFLVIAALLILSGCSSSSNTVRYGDKPDNNTSHNNSDARFTSANDDNSDNNYDRNDTTSYNVRIAEPDNSDPDVLPENEPPVDFSGVVKKISPSSGSNDLSSDYGTPKERMLMEILKFVNTPYKYGGSNKKGIDCSAFTQMVYNKSLSVHLQRTAGQQYHEGVEIDDVDNLRFGDLVFFDTRRTVKPGHVGIYIGDHLFAHASNKGVTVSSLDLSYYANRFMGGRRIEPDEFGAKQ